MTSYSFIVSYFQIHHACKILKITIPLMFILQILLYRKTQNNLQNFHVITYNVMLSNATCVKKKNAKSVIRQKWSCLLVCFYFDMVLFLKISKHRESAD